MTELITLVTGLLIVMLFWLGMMAFFALALRPIDRPAQPRQNKVQQTGDININIERLEINIHNNQKSITNTDARTVNVDKMLVQNNALPDNNHNLIEHGERFDVAAIEANPKRIEQK